MRVTGSEEYHINPSPRHSSPVTASYSALPFPFYLFSFPCFSAALALTRPRPRFSSSFILCLRRNLDPNFARLKVSLRRNKPYGRIVAFILALPYCG